MRMKIKRFELVRDSANDEYYKLLYYIIEDNFFEHLTVDLCVDCFLQLDEYDNCIGWYYKKPGRHGKIIACFLSMVNVLILVESFTAYMGCF